MNQYSDIQVIECNRLHSEESKANNNENFALWQNNLQDILHFQAGDKISVHGAMISERGAGQSSSIEIKGESLGITHTFDTINLSTSIKSLNESNRTIFGADLITATVNSSTVEMFDNKDILQLIILFQQMVIIILNYQEDFGIVNMVPPIITKLIITHKIHKVLECH